jgi:sulfate transport system permease protein
MAKSRRILPGFGLSLGYTVVYLSILVLIPFSGLLLKTSTGGWEHFFKTITEPRVVASYYVSFGISLVAALVNGVFGVIAAWVLARYEFPGRKILDAIVDLPFALPTAVAGIALTTIYAKNGAIGSLLEPYGIKVAYTQFGIFVALTFIGLPFVVRTVQPVIQDLSADMGRFPEMKTTEPNSPTARPYARVMPVSTEGSRAGKITRLKVCHRLAPSVAAASSFQNGNYTPSHHHKTRAI